MYPLKLRGEGEYLKQREALLEAELALRDQMERVAEMRRQLPDGGPVEDYVFREGNKDLNINDPASFCDTRLSELFEDGKDHLILIHLMFHPEHDAPCVMCSMWADGYNAIAPHVRQNANFVMVAKAEIGKFRAWAKGRGWDNIRLLSSHDTSFNTDFHVEDEDGDQMPGITIFTRQPDGRIHHTYTGQASLGDSIGRGIDVMTPVWNLFDLLPQGRPDWFPGHDYMNN